VSSRLTLELGLVLYNESLVLVVNGGWELGGDGVVSGLVLEHETLVAVDGAEHSWLLDRPGTDVLPLLFGLLLLGVGHSPSVFPVIGELLEEWGFEGSWLVVVSAAYRRQGSSDIQ